MARTLVQQSWIDATEVDFEVCPGCEGCDECVGHPVDCTGCDACIPFASLVRREVA